MINIFLKTGIVESESQIHRILSGVTFIAGANVAACSAILFSIFILKPKISKWKVAPIVVFVIVNTLVCLLWGVLGEGMTMEEEWVAKALPLRISFGIVAGMGFAPSLVFLAYATNVQGFSQKTGGYTLSVGFIMLGYFTFLSDIFGIAPELVIRRIGVAVGMVFVHLGFFIPPWYLDFARRLVPKR
jgi:hypothetical protein